MEQNKSEDALVTIRRAKSNIDCSSTSSSTLLCVRILAQEADISREVGRYAEAVRVSFAQEPRNDALSPTH